MSATIQDVKKAVGQPGDEESESPDVESLLESAASGRTRVERVLEHVQGDLTPDRVHYKDWLAAIEHVRNDTGEELVLYSENTHPETWKSATVRALDDKYGRVIQWGWGEFRADNADDGNGFAVPQYVNRDDVEEGFMYYQSGDSTPDFMLLEDAIERVKQFAAEHGSNGGDA